MAFSPRTTEAGIWDNPYWYDPQYNRGAQSGLGLWLPNCSTYAYGRSVQIAGGQIDRDTILNGRMPNAADWYNAAVWEKSTNYNNIRLGDIVVWGEGGGVGNAGHVAVVEAIDANYVYTSNSHYNFYGQTKTYPATDSKRYFEYARHPKNMTTYTRLYYYNPNGSYGGNYPSWNCPNFLGCIHNPYADQEPPEPPTPDTDLTVIYTLLAKRRRGGGNIIL